MTLNLNLWWTGYAVLVVAAFIWALASRASERPRGDYDFAFWIPAAFRLAAAIIGSLILCIVLLIAGA